MRLTLVLIAAWVSVNPVSSAAADDSAPGPISWVATTAERYVGYAHELVLQAMGLIGIGYKWGGSSPITGFDCSGFVNYVFSQAAGLILPRNALEISRVGQKIEREELMPGDLVFFNTLRRPFSHVGIYLGDHRFIHAPARGGQVEIVRMSDRYWATRYNGARRISI